MKCTHCNFESEKDFERCPSCGAQVTSPKDNSAANAAGTAGQSYQQTYQSPYQSPYQTPYQTPYQPNNYYANGSAYASGKKSGGEIAAIVTAVIVSILSVVAMFFIFIAFVTYATVNLPYSSSNDEDFYDFYNGNNFNFSNEYGLNSPAGKNTPIEFNDELYSFSNGYVDTTYEVEMEETYRGDAALKLLEGAKLPELTDSEEIYLVKFKVTVTDQDEKAYVAIYPSYSYHMNNSSGMTTHNTLYSIDYANQTELIMEGESGTRWMAYVIDKEANKDANPYIMWDIYEGKYFQNEDESISDPSKVTSGEAVEKSDEDDNGDDTSSSETSSQE